MTAPARHARNRAHAHCMLYAGRRPQTVACAPAVPAHTRRPSCGALSAPTAAMLWYSMWSHGSTAYIGEAMRGLHPVACSLRPASYPMYPQAAGLTPPRCRAQAAGAAGHRIQVSPPRCRARAPSCRLQSAGCSAHQGGCESTQRCPRGEALRQGGEWTDTSARRWPWWSFVARAHALQPVLAVEVSRGVQIWCMIWCRSVVQAPPGLARLALIATPQRT